MMPQHSRSGLLRFLEKGEDTSESSKATSGARSEALQQRLNDLVDPQTQHGADKDVHIENHYLNALPPSRAAASA